LTTVDLTNAFGRAIYDALDYSIADVEQAVGGPVVISSDKTKALMSRMREPSLSIHGIEGAFYGAGAKTVIPAKVIGKFSIRYGLPSIAMKQRLMR
jgi:Cys-Gly metallodipeptidase DUG1